MEFRFLSMLLFALLLLGLRGIMIVASAKVDHELDPARYSNRHDEKGQVQFSYAPHEKSIQAMKKRFLTSNIFKCKVSGTLSREEEKNLRKAEVLRKVKDMEDQFNEILDSIFSLKLTYESAIQDGLKDERKRLQFVHSRIRLFVRVTSMEFVKKFLYPFTSWSKWKLLLTVKSLMKAQSSLNSYPALPKDVDWADIAEKVGCHASELKSHHEALDHSQMK